MSADRLIQAPGNGARLHRQELGVEGRAVSNRRQPLERALAVVELPLGVRVRARRAHRELDIDEQHVSARGDQLVRQLAATLGAWLTYKARPARSLLKSSEVCDDGSLAQRGPSPDDARRYGRRE